MNLHPPIARPLGRPASPPAEALRSLRRAIGTLRSYPHGNELTERALVDLEQRMRSALPLRLAIGPDGGLEDAAGPLEVEEGLRGLVLALHGDGIRELRIGAGMARPELDRFVAALATPRDADDLSEDYVTLLWEAQLPSLGVTALDPYLERDLPGDVLEGKEVPSGEVEGIEAEPPASTPPPPEEAFRLSDADREDLADELRRAAAEPPWPSFVCAVRELLRGPIARRRTEEVLAVAEATLFRLVAERQLGLARSLARELRELADAGEAGFPEVLGRASRADRLEALRAATEADPGQQSLAREILLALGEGSLAAIQGFLRRAASAAPRRAWADTLAAFGEPGRAYLGALLAEGDGALAACAAQVLTSGGDRRWAPEIWTAFESATGPARRDLFRTLAALGGDASRDRILAVALADADEPCRLLALSELVRCVGRAAAAPLLARVRSRAFDGLDEREKDALFRALALAGGDEVVDFLAESLSGSWRLLGDPSERIRAARALAREGSPAARAALRERANGRGALAEICRQALRGTP